jgi:hypothetical protein
MKTNLSFSESERFVEVSPNHFVSLISHLLDRACRVSRSWEGWLAPASEFFSVEKLLDPFCWQKATQRDCGGKPLPKLQLIPEVDANTNC